MTDIACHHGLLRRACEICERDAEIADLQGEIAKLRAVVEAATILHDIGRAGAIKRDHLGGTVTCPCGGYWRDGTQEMHAPNCAYSPFFVSQHLAALDSPAPARIVDMPEPIAKAVNERFWEMMGKDSPASASTCKCGHPFSAHHPVCGYAPIGSTGPCGCMEFEPAPACPTCGGAGSAPAQLAAGMVNACPTCGGNGCYMVSGYRNQAESRACEACHGTGKREGKP